jgi:hypothetical protein
LIDGSLKTILDNKKISKALIKNSVEKLADNKRLYRISDHCDNRKQYSSKLENLGKIRDLNGKLINGYTTLCSILLDENKQNLTLSNVTVFSNKEKNFVKNKDLKDFHNGKIKNKKEIERIKELVKENTYINMTTTFKEHLKAQNKALKEANPNVEICDIHDRYADSVEYFEFITEELGNDFVIRGKKNRNSEQTKIVKVVDKKTGEEKEKEVKIKLFDSKFENQKVYLIEKMTMKGKCYQHAKSFIEWQKIKINEKDYTAVRVTLSKRDGTKIHKEPMLLITSLSVTNYLEAKEIYHIYLLRSKIEAVFKFLKDVLGWEEFQVRDWESIKNIIAICFFVGEYFYEIESELTKNPTVIMICNLGEGKGKITRFYFLKGLKKLLIAQNVENFKKNNDISEELFKEMQEYAGIEDIR